MKFIVTLDPALDIFVSLVDKYSNQSQIDTLGGQTLFYSSAQFMSNVTLSFHIK